MSVHQNTKLSTNPKHYHDNEVKRTCKHLKGIKDKGLVLKPDLKKGLETHVGAYFSGVYDKAYSEDTSTVHSR